MDFAEILLSWYDREKRDLPWRGTKDPYRIWISEIMLQQTRAEAVAPRYEAFLRQFPDVFDLARAGEEEVLKAWEGMGYYSRARNLHRAAKEIAAEGAFPQTAEDWRKLPGVGAYTAGAVASIAFGEAVPSIDGNQVRVLSRVLAWEGEGLEAEAAIRVDRKRPGDYNQALMDLGAEICTPRRPNCARCPVARMCRAYLAGDPEAFPIKRAALPKQEERRIVLLAIAQGRVLVRKRPAGGMLAGLWEFPNYIEGEENPLPEAREICALREAKHVFTHRVWHMRGILAEIRSVPEGYLAADARDLEALAMPSAFRVYRKIAMERIGKER